jgi:hypothetical protein
LQRRPPDTRLRGKGAFHDHFSSTQEVFERVLDDICSELAVLVAKRAQAGTARTAATRAGQEHP